MKIKINKESNKMNEFGIKNSRKKSGFVCGKRKNYIVFWKKEAKQGQGMNLIKFNEKIESKIEILRKFYKKF